MKTVKSKNNVALSIPISCLSLLGSKFLENRILIMKNSSNWRCDITPNMPYWCNAAPSHCLDLDHFLDKKAPFSKFTGCLSFLSKVNKGDFGLHQILGINLAHYIEGSITKMTLRRKRP